MKYVTETKHVPLGFGEIAGGALDGQAVTLKGAVHSLRAMGGITFLALRVRDGAVQCVCRPEELPEGLCEECAAVVTGTVRREERAPGGRELAAEEPYWLIGGWRLCPDCLPDFARAEYRSCLRLPGRKEGTE